MTQPLFVPKPGQVDFTNIRYCPVINTVVTDGEKILLVKRSSDMNLYPNCWNGISGFLDDKANIEDKVYEELREELGVGKEQVLAVNRGRPLLQEAPQYNKTWLVVPMLATLKSQITPTTDWEAQDFKWFQLDEIAGLDLLPGFINVIKEFYPKMISFDEVVAVA